MSEPNVLNVARYVVEKLGSMTTMKLQKLTYYCQAWSLAWDDLPLFQDDFQAWANGPVCYELYNKHKDLFLIELHKNKRKPFSIQAFRLFCASLIKLPTATRKI